MTEPVKRAYSSTVRAEQAARTRQRIVDAAGELFVADGYPATTVRAIAERAGVAVDTVYSTFGSKVRVLTALIDRRLAPAGEQSVLDRPESLAVRDEPDTRRQIRLFAHDIAAISAHVRPVAEMLRVAAAVEPDAAPVLVEMEEQRRRNMARPVEWFGARGPLRVEADRAADIVFAVTSPELARLLCDVRGWTQEEYADWLDDTLARALLPDAD